MAGIAFDEGKQCGEERERGQAECHCATSAGEGPAWREHLAHGETTSGRLNEDGRPVNSGFRLLRTGQRHLPVRASTKATSVARWREGRTAAKRAPACLVEVHACVSTHS